MMIAKMKIFFCVMKRKTSSFIKISIHTIYNEQIHENRHEINVFLSEKISNL